MITSLVSDALRIKCRFENAKMTGNYECAYATGVLSALSGVEEISELKDIKKMKEEVEKSIGRCASDEPEIKQLIKIFMEYEPSDETDLQMDELYHMAYRRKGI